MDMLEQRCIQDEGRKAYLSDISRDACPYSEHLTGRKLRKAWLEGWDAALTRDATGDDIPLI